MSLKTKLPSSKFTQNQQEDMGCCYKPLRDGKWAMANHLWNKKEYTTAVLRQNLKFFILFIINPKQKNVVIYDFVHLKKKLFMVTKYNMT